MDTVNIPHEPSMANDTYAMRRAMNATTFEDLIPDELKAAVGEVEAKQPTPVDDRPTRQPTAVDDRPTRQPAPVDDRPTKQPAPVDDIPMDDDSLDLSSPDAIDKLIAGDLEALKPNKQPKPVEHPWYSNDVYKKMLTRGISKDELDKLILEASDTKILDTSKYAQSVEEKANQYEQELGYTKKELERLKILEKEKHFDLMPEVTDTFIKPMEALSKEIKGIVALEGINVSTKDILNAPDRVSLVKMFEDENITDQDLSRITNFWRSYKELEYNYNIAKNDALNNSKSILNERIPEAEVGNLLRDGMVEFLQSDTKYKYIDDAIRDGIEKHKDVTDVIGIASADFKNIVKAISNPLDYSRNVNWLKGLAKYTLKASHAMNMEQKYYQANEELANIKQQRDKLAQAYKKLLSSGKGITGTRGMAFKPMSSKEDDKEIESKYEAFLNNRISIEDIL